MGRGTVPPQDQQMEKRVLGVSLKSIHSEGQHRAVAENTGCRAGPPKFEAQPYPFPARLPLFRKLLNLPGSEAKVTTLYVYKVAVNTQ